MENLKSRDIPVNDLFYYLQLEWISYNIRSKIYERGIDIKRFTDICKMKKEKIDMFSLRNSVPSIFSKKERMEKYLNEFYSNENTTPKFQYTPKNKESLSKWDKNYFYKAGLFVYFNGELVQILTNDTLNNKVSFLASRREFKTVSYTEVFRDLTLLD